jgi:hypothetical protein
MLFSDGFFFFSVGRSLLTGIHSDIHSESFSLLSCCIIPVLHSGPSLVLRRPVLVLRPQAWTGLIESLPSLCSSPSSSATIGSRSNNSSSPAIIMSGSGGFYKYRCKYFYTHNCTNWVYVNNSPCANCLVSSHLNNPNSFRRRGSSWSNIAFTRLRAGIPWRPHHHNNSGTSWFPIMMTMACAKSASWSSSRQIPWASTGVSGIKHRCRWAPPLPATRRDQSTPRPKPLAPAASAAGVSGSSIITP